MISPPFCACLKPQFKRRGGWEVRLHAEAQDEGLDVWKRLLDLVELAAEDGRETFSPAEDLGREDWWRVVTLPPSIAKLKAVRTLALYGSGLKRIPPEIGRMDSLVAFDPYTSYRLHWLPFEITRCRDLAESRISTRALYGNFKYRPPFPRLPQAVEALAPGTCSVCDQPFGPATPIQRWISLRVATDVVPLLVHACSVACLGRLPESAGGYVAGAHAGGPGLSQPEPR